MLTTHADAFRKTPDFEAVMAVMNRPKRTKPKYDGRTWDSFSELQMYWWIQDAIRIGLCRSVVLQPGFVLAPKVEVKKPVRLKTKTGYRKQVLLREKKYHPDFTLDLSKEGKERLKALEWIQTEAGDYVLDVKPPKGAGPGTQDRVFKDRQAWLWQQHKVFVNRVDPMDVFRESFVPLRCMFTKTGRLSNAHQFRGRHIAETYQPKG